MIVELERDGQIAVITINRPRALNGLDLSAFQELHERLIEFRDDPELLVGIITGTGTRAFSIGADVKEMLPYLRDSLKGPKALPSSIMRGLKIWKPLIAAINGMALGGGLEIALACDLRIASERARFGTPEVTLGLIPGWGGTQRLPRMLPWCQAAELLLTGRIIDAPEAYRIGLINLVVPTDQVLPVAKEWAETICKAAPLAVRAAKEAMVRGYEMDLDDGLDLENELESQVCASEDFAEGLAARAGKRKPVYRGK